MDRLTTDKPAAEMSMIELALNCCYGKDGWVRYRDFDVDIDLLDLMREYMDSYAPEDYVPADNKEFVEALWDNLQYDPIVDGSGLVALLHRNMWALAELREHLKAYEDTGLTPEECNKFLRNISELEKQLDRYTHAEAEGRLIVLPCKVGDTVYLTTHNGKVTRGTVVSFRFRGKLMVDIEYNHFGTYATSRYWGETVFLTREEAEAALKKEVISKND